MKNRFNKTDQRILITAIALLLLFLCLLYDDSFLKRWTKSDALPVAKIIQPENDVRQKDSAEFLWGKVRRPQSVHFGDSIFTGDDSFAWIELDDGSQFYVGPNSLVVFNMTGDQLKLALKFGTLGGQLNGFLNVEGLDLCGQGQNFEIKSDGSGKMDVHSPQGGIYTNCEKNPKPVRKIASLESQTPEITYPRDKSRIRRIKAISVPSYI